jgi:enamine deaminase RidA (YjgF/YER057c/UK114 family)
MNEQKTEGAGEWEGWPVVEDLPQSANTAKQIINPPELPVPRGFSHGIAVEGGRLLMLAGQDASGADGVIRNPGDLLAQYEQVVKNLKAVVEAAGGTLQDVVKLNIYVTDRDTYRAQLKPLGEIYRAYFGRHYPAMALFEVRGLFNPDAMIEMEGVAHLVDRRAVP